MTNYAAYWHHLGTFKEFDQAYLDALANATRVLTDRDVERTLNTLTDTQGKSISVRLGEESSPLLHQIRTNDRALSPDHEFRQCSVKHGSISAAMLDGTPAAVFLDSKTKENRALTKLLNENKRSIKNGTFAIPASLRGQSRRHRISLFAGSSIIPDNDPAFHWSMNRNHDGTVRRRFAMGTCNGCHSAETQTQFFHIEPRAAGEEAKISKFLSFKGPLEVPDPAHPRASVQLNEMGQRIALFTAALNPSMRTNQIRLRLKKHQRQNH